jgi:RecB family exonuclease
MCRPAEREQSRALRALLDRIDDMADLEVLLDDRRDVPFSEMVEWLERAATSGSPAPGAIDDGGIRVLDAMQARGLTFRSVALLGFHSGLWPRIAHEDPFLPDPARAALREATGAPLEGKAEGEAEERLLLAMLLGSAKDSIDVSWQRADEAGRSKSPSLALREVSRLVLGRPDLEALLASARRLSSHPARAVEDLLDATGLLGPDEEMLLLASRGGTEAEKALLERDGALGPAIAMLLATEAFAAGDGGFDGRVGAGSPLPALSVTAIERLGRCPLQFFFRHRLGVYPIEEEAGVFDLGVNEWGNLIHGVLDRTYRSIASEGVLSGDEPKVLERADSLLLDAWREVFGDVGKRLGRRFPVLWRVAVERYREALRAFVREDLLRIRTEGATLQGCEDRRTGVLDLGDGVLLSLEGRLDRVIEVAGVPWIGDYKTSGKLRPRGDRTKMLKGQWLQAPLYWMLGGETGVVELLGVGPDHEPGTGFDVGDRRVPFFGFGEGEGRAGFVETVRELVGLAQEGRFPLHDDWQCRFCDYRRACRRSHPPTMNREASWEDSAAFRDLQRKSMKVPTLALVRAQRVQEDEEEGFS